MNRNRIVKGPGNNEKVSVAGSIGFGRELITGDDTRKIGEAKL